VTPRRIRMQSGGGQPQSTGRSSSSWPIRARTRLANKSMKLTARRAVERGPATPAVIIHSRAAAYAQCYVPELLKSDCLTINRK